MPSARLPIARVARVLSTALLLAAAAVATASEARQPVPDGKARSAVVSALKKEWKDAYRGKDAAVKVAAARALIERAGAAGDDHVTRYVLLDEATGLAEDAREHGLIITAHRELARHFDVSAAGPALKSVAKAARGGKGAGPLFAAANACIDIAGLALTENDAGTAKKAISAAQAHAKKAKLGGLQARANALEDLVSVFRNMSKLAATARETLGETPGDGASERAVAWHNCFGMGYWVAGLYQLAKSDGVLKELAAAAAAPPADAAARLDRADQWWAYAETESSVLVQARVRARAADHYEAALADEKATELPAERVTTARERLAAITYRAWDGYSDGGTGSGGGVALTTDFSKSGPSSLGLASIQAFIEREKIDTKSSNWRTKLKPPPADIEYAPGVEYFWTLLTNKGEIRARFFPDTAPKHVTHFIYLTELGFFDGRTFHRVIPKFMAQGGSPDETANGYPGYFIHGETDGPRKHDKPGILSTANTGSPKSDGSQFFITFAPTPNLNGKHTIFGEVISGMDVVKAIEKEGTAGAGKPKSRLEIVTATVSTK